ncbi:MAG: hypothetical protein HYT85_03210 [candidate division NC10 bacterium]|nr:hypothetical protein [candidate division NC10 bacterium]MBI2114085.1 hypothetical protein [candidate division NC10 bacterium]MBI3086128.1 hypothetical protein [candidate division NC10 bacterium]
MRRDLCLAVLVVVAVVGWAEAGLAATTAQAKLSQQLAGGGVTVAATLLKNQAEATAIKLVLDTHSANLDGYKFEAIATLRDDSGKTYPVEAVEQASGGGHHRQAVLRFGKADPQAKSLELIVKDVAGVKERIFRWSTAE